MGQINDRIVRVEGSSELNVDVYGEASSAVSRRHMHNHSLALAQSFSFQAVSHTE